MSSTIKYRLLSLREWERDANMLKAIFLFSLTHLAYSVTYLLLLRGHLGYSAN